MEKVNVLEKFSKFDAVWKPKIVGELNGQYVKLGRFRGPFVWHDHAEEDELFFVVQGSIRIELRDQTVELGEGEFFIVPRGVEHRPVADEEALVMMFEPKATVNTGAVENELTHTDLEKL